MNGSRRPDTSRSDRDHAGKGPWQALRCTAFGSPNPLEISRVTNRGVPLGTPFKVESPGLVGILLFRLAWLRVAYAIVLPLLVLLVTVVHARTRRRFRTFDLPWAFLSQYEYSRIVTYSALVVPLAMFAWIVYR